MEQRNGRIDRHGQRHNPLVYHFVGEGYKEREKPDIDVPVGELEGDLEFLMRAVRKVEAIREDLGKVGPVIADQVQEAMLGQPQATGYAAGREGRRACTQRCSRFERDIEQDIKRLRDQLDETKRELRLSPENIEHVVEVGLKLADQPALIRFRTSSGRWPDPKREVIPAFRLPALSGSWALCTEGLAHPHTQEIRPIVFDPNLSPRAMTTWCWPT